MLRAPRSVREGRCLRRLWRAVGASGHEGGFDV